MKYTNCPKCGNNLEQYKCTTCDFVFYQNSKPTASALIIKDNKILLGRRSIEPSKGMWDIPGGFCNYGEHPEDAVKREALEETSLIVEPKEVLGIFMDEYGVDKESTLNIAYIVNIVGGEEKAGDDLEKLEWFSYDKLPSDIAFENGRQMIEAWKNKL